MANNPQKTKDATDDALLAIEEALNGRAPAPSAASPRERREAQEARDTEAAIDVRRELAPTAPDAPDLFHTDDEAPHWAGGSTAPRQPANDDRASMGQILQTLRRRRARTPYVIASIAALAWAAGGLALAYLSSADLQALFATPRVGLAAMVGIASALAVPVIFFYVIAHMFSRSQDMRLVAESMAEVAMRLAQPETSAREQVVSVGQAIRREVAAMGDGVERALARAAELEALVHNEVSALERAYNDNEVRIRDLLSELTNQRETLVSQSEHVRKAIGGVHLDLSHDITSVGDLVAEKVNEVAQRVTRSLTEKGEHITLALGHAGDSMIDALSERGSTLLDRLESTSDKATTAIASASDRLSASLNFKTEHVHDEFAEMAVRLQQMMTARLDQVAQGFAQKTDATIETMAGRSQQFTDTITQTGGQMADSIATRANEMNAALRSTGDSVVLDLSRRGDDIVTRMEQTGAHITDTLGSRSDAVRDMLAARLQTFEEVFSHGGTELSEKISRDSSTLGNLINRHISEFDHTVKTYGGELVERLGQRTDDVAQAMRAYLDTFDERVTGRTDELSGTLDARLAQLETLLGSRVGELASTLTDGGKEMIGALDQRIGEVTGTINTRGAEVADAISAKIGEMDQTLGSRAMEVADTLDNRITRFEQLLVGRAVIVTEQIETRTQAAADALNARMEQLSESIKTNTDGAERSLSALALNTTDAIRSSASEAERTLIGVSDEIARNIVSRADEIANLVSQRTNEMAAVLSDKSGGVLHAIVEKGQQFASDITKASDDVMRSIEDKGVAFNRTLLDNGTEITRLINAAGETAATSVTRTLDGLQQTAQKAIDRSKETATSTVTEIMETHNMLRSDTTALFERLREANIMLQEVLSGSHENMSALENTLMLRVSDFVTAMNEVTASTADATDRVEVNINNFREITAHVVTDLGQLAGEFDAHGRDLVKASALINESNQRTEDTVNERRAQLDSLVATLDIRTEDIDKRLTRFSSLLDESLEAAAERAREIARVVSESSAEGTRAIGAQHESIRANAEDERRRTAEAMRAVYEQTTADADAMFRDANARFAEAADGMRAIYEHTVGDTQSIFTDAGQRFAETVHGMKQMAAEMQRELEATRSELRRGVFELPQETAESAAQMRRVIVDQIEALAELNRIVARHGRGLDAVEPTARRSREEPTLAIASARSEVPPPRQPAARQPAPRADIGGFAPTTRRAEAPSLSPVQSNAGKGWLSDLLTRASREEVEPLREPPREIARTEERSPRHSIESLDSLSVDIARMIDHDAAADLWDRYKSGERNVFTRRLYTLQGQQAFDEIRKKYRADREFKQTVDRYIGEFERLLEEVSRDDRGQVVARTYLTSETGKVYTMLAHAAGRFD